MAVGQTANSGMFETFDAMAVRLALEFRAGSRSFDAEAIHLLWRTRHHVLKPLVGTGIAHLSSIS